MKNIMQKMLLITSFTFLFYEVNGMKSKDEVLRQLNQLAGITEETTWDKKEEIDPLRVSRRRVLFSKGDENLETVVKQIIFFNNINKETIQKFENKFMETFSNIEIAQNAFNYINLVIDSHNEQLKKDYFDLDISKIENGFFKLAWRIKWAKKNNMHDIVKHRIKIFNTFIAFLTGVTGKLNAKCWKIIQLQQDEKEEYADIIAKIQTFNPDLKWPEAVNVNGFPVFSSK